MLILGFFVVATFILIYMSEPFIINEVFTQESCWMLAFMVYLLPLGWITSPATNAHLTQWMTSMEYLLIMIVISSLVMFSGTESFHLLLLLTAIFLAVVLLMNPMSYKGTDRYSISDDVNPNSLGIAFASGTWGVLYFQQKKKCPLVVAAGVIILLCYSIIITGSRKGLIAAGIVVVLWTLFCYLPQVKNSNNPWKPLILVFSITVFLALLVVLSRLYADSDMAARMDDLERETTTGSRASLYRTGWDLFQRHPLLGMGFQSFKYYDGFYSHATIVEVPVSGGIVGSLLYFAAYLVSIRKCVIIYRQCRYKMELIVEKTEIKMLLILWIAMLFYCSCIIHPYQFDSYYIFGIIFGQSAYIEKKILTQQDDHRIAQGRKCKWIK